MLYKKELISIVGLFMLIACSSSLWDDLPEPIATFISTYYPMSGISEYNEHNGVYYVTIKNGATMTLTQTTLGLKSTATESCCLNCSYKTPSNPNLYNTSWSLN